MPRRLNTMLAACAAAVCLAYLSLFVQGSVIAKCGDIGYGPFFCPVKAYGFPLPFLADNQFISPVGTVSRNPIWVLIGEDHVLWPAFGLSLGFWLVVVVLGHALWLHVRRRFPG